MRVRMGWFMVCAALLIGGCGVGPEANALARREAGLLATLPADDEGVRRTLLRQPDAWSALAVQLERKQLGGMPVGGDFRELVRETGQLARRLRVLIEAGEDDAAANREALLRLQGLWRKSSEYLMP